MHVFLTGATGALGTRVVPLLVAAGHAVTAVSRRAESDAALRAVGATPVRVDLLDPDGVRDAVLGHEVVAHLATHIPTGARALRTTSWGTSNRLRREASSLLVDAAASAGALQYLQESLAFAYVDGGDRWLDEDTPLDPHPVQAAIRDAEAAAARFTAGGGTGVALRFGVFYGPGAAHTVEELAAARRGFAARFGKPDAYIPAVHLDDAATAVLAALEVPAGVYNVVDDRPLTRREHAAALGAALGVPRLRLPPSALGRLGKLRAIARSHRVANARFRAASSWRPRHPSAREGWRAVVALEDRSTPGTQTGS
jgi:nucleoside-diphosphate-sugar epimerase